MVQTFLRLLERAGERGGAPARAWVWLGATADAVWGGIGARLGRSVAGGESPDRRGMGIEREGRMMGMIGDLVSDLRFGIRALVRRPVFTSTAMAALALGVGASAAIFSVVNGFVLKPLPYEEPGRLVALWSAHPERGWSRTDVSMPEAREWGERSDALAAVSIHDDRRVALTGGDRPEFVDAIYATANVFDVVGVEPVLGRGFVPEDNREGAEGVTVLTHDFWRARFGGDPGVLGRTLTLNDDPYTVVGVLPEGFYYTDEFADLFIPWRVDPATARRGNHSMEAVGRLAPGATLERLREDLDRIARQQADAHPEENEGWRAQVVPLRTDVAGEEATRASLILMVAGAFVLLMACVNVANLLLARANGRRRELAVRAAMGAGRGRVVRQLLVESGILAVLGGSLGILLAAWGSGAIASGMPEFLLTPARRFSMDWRVLAFTV
ncbi:MAG: FtsX-like permease family protein, partial [Gemmatimonadetes bacterium]|nr:FtsX-like permease family protein [Gemmatimonadota bacterium]NIR79531.1 FtsX-like permease family protein [Gemmatimonadota bacterium]NIT88207.1 FtsX-like permease family protein [Gemmatimonadota bacterium]NIU32015.1 FtsX-like permease family protein [Gemmatimonadota bacterium]NIU36624.1 FtsX-like permease family protein [Gemmatimonadota bacterium]